MIVVLWGLIGGAAGLLLLIVASIAHLHETMPSVGTTALWLVISPVAVVGAMVHRRRMSERYSYLDAAKTGIFTSLIVSGGLLIAWIVYILVIEPEFFSLMITRMEQASKASGELPAVTKARINAAMLINSSPTFYLISVVVPFLSGVIAAVVAAVGLKKKS